MRRELGSTAVAIDMPIAPEITSAAMIGAAKAIWNTKPSARPISTSLATASMPASESRFAGGCTCGNQAQTNTASAPVAITRTCTGTEPAPKIGAATMAAPMRVITNTSRQNSASSAPKPKSSAIMLARRRWPRKSPR